MPAPVTRLTWWLRVQTPFIRSGVSVAMGVAGIGVHLGGWLPLSLRCWPVGCEVMVFTLLGRNESSGLAQVAWVWWMLCQLAMNKRRCYSMPPHPRHCVPAHTVCAQYRSDGFCQPIQKRWAASISSLLWRPASMAPFFRCECAVSWRFPL